MTIRELTFLEDKYKQLKQDYSLLESRIKECHKDNDIQTMLELIEEQIEINDFIRFIDDFITFAGYHWKEYKNDYMLFKKIGG